MTSQSQLPGTPAEVLAITSPVLRAIISVSVKWAEITGLWRSPRTGAAASIEEMNLLDMIYWVYKTDHPILLPEKTGQSEFTLQLDGSIVGLPEGFQTEEIVTMGACGDLLRCKGLDHSADRLFEHVSDLLFEKDISYGNLESPITTQPLVDEVIGGGGPPIECCSKEQFQILKGHKDNVFDVLNTANNHTFDMGVEGLETTASTLAEYGILNIGVNATPGDQGKAQVLTKKGISFGFVADTFGLNGHDVPEQERHRINVSKLCSKTRGPDLSLLKAQLDDARAKGCDFTVATLHWGHEFEFFPREQQIKAARDLVEMGADCVLCHHPHVIQPVEYYRTQRDPDRVAVIAYSLGSVCWGFMAPYLALNMILNLEFAKGHHKGQPRTYIKSATVTPTFRNHVMDGDCRIMRLEKLSDYVASGKQEHPAGYMEEIRRLADMVLSAEAAG